MATDSTSVPRPKASSFFRRAKIAAGIGTVAIMAFHAAPHVFPQLNKKILEVKPKQVVHENHQHIFMKACRDMGIKNHEDIELFYNISFSTVSAGSCELPNKAVIGLPRMFLLKDAETLRESGISLHNIPIDWDLKSGKALEKALIPKDEHIAFGIAHELAHIKNNDFIYRCLLPATWFYTTCRLLLFIVPRARGAPNIWLKGLLTIMLSGISLLGYNEANNFMKCKFEMHADQKAAKCGVEYKNGGISYLKSRLRINRVLRHLTGVVGVQRYTEKGDDLHDRGHPSITDRIQRLKSVKIE